MDVAATDRLVEPDPRPYPAVPGYGNAMYATVEMCYPDGEVPTAGHCNAYLPCDPGPDTPMPLTVDNDPAASP